MELEPTFVEVLEHPAVLGQNEQRFVGLLVVLVEALALADFAPPILGAVRLGIGLQRQWEHWIIRVLTLRPPILILNML